MTRLNLTPHLTIPEGYEQRRLHTRSHKGQAHFAGTGPATKSCRECVSWQSIGGYNKDGPKPSPCRKFRELTGKVGAAVPHSAHSCKYFEQHPTPPRLRMFDFGGDQ